MLIENQRWKTELTDGSRQYVIIISDEPLYPAYT